MFTTVLQNVDWNFLPKIIQGFSEKEKVAAYCMSLQISIYSLTYMVPLRMYKLPMPCALMHLHKIMVWLAF